MRKRLLSCNASDFTKMSKEDILEAIALSEGRVIVGETIGTLMPMLGDITNAEFVASMGADIIILNMFDVDQPIVQGLPSVSKEGTIHKIKELTGRIVGINLEPVEECFSSLDVDFYQLTNGRKATLSNAKRAYEMGANFILLTGNPGTGVSNTAIVNSLKTISKELGNEIILAAGKMHASGILSEAGDTIISKEDIKDFVDAGANIILLPAPGTIPGITVEMIRELVVYAHKLGVLTLTAIGTSQEGADSNTIREIALMCKMTGTDMHHLGDSGYGGMALPENITTYSIAIRGIRHTYHRMAASIRR